MSRFRYAGYYNGSTPWKVSLAVKALGQQIEDRWPSRHPADGTLASSGHAKWPTSDHGADPRGIVRAIDIGTYLGQGPDLFSELRRSRDPRIRYVIHGNEMFSSYPAQGKPPWTLRPYVKGGHDHHVHVSVLTDDGVDKDDSEWEIGEDMAAAVEGIQRNLNLNGFTDMNGEPLVEDGKWGPKTEYAHLLMCEAAKEVQDLELETSTVRVVKTVRLKE